MNDSLILVNKANEKELKEKYDSLILEDNAGAYIGGFGGMYIVSFSEAGTDTAKEYGNHLTIYRVDNEDEPEYYDFLDINTLEKANEVYKELKETSGLIGIIKKYNGINNG